MIELFLAITDFEYSKRIEMLEKKNSLRICKKGWRKALIKLIRAPLAVFLMMVEHFLVTFFELVVMIVISISNMVAFANLTVALQSAPDRIVIAYIGFRIQQNNKKLETQISLKIFTKNLTKALIPLVSTLLDVLLMVFAHVLGRI